MSIKYTRSNNEDFYKWKLFDKHFLTVTKFLYTHLFYMEGEERLHLYSGVKKIMYAYVRRPVKFAADFRLIPVTLPYCAIHITIWVILLHYTIQCYESHHHTTAIRLQHYTNHIAVLHQSHYSTIPITSANYISD